MLHKPRRNEQVEANQTWHLQKILPGHKAPLEVRDVMDIMGERGTYYLAKLFVKTYGRRYGAQKLIIPWDDMQKYRRDGTLMEFMAAHRPRAVKKGVYQKKGVKYEPGTEKTGTKD